MKYLLTLLILLTFNGIAQPTLPITYKEIDATMKADGKIILPLIQFENGTAKLLASSEPQLKEISRYISAYKKKTFIVVHTDNALPLQESIELSESRAEAIRKELSDNYMIGISLIEPKGVGSLCPITSNNSEKKVSNNRVELVLQ